MADRKVRADQLVVGMVLTPGLGGGSTRNGMAARAVVVKVEVGEEREIGIHTATASDKGLWAYQYATPGFMFTVEVEEG